MPKPAWNPEAAGGQVAGLIAAHNEGGGIFQVVQAARRHLQRWLVVADGCSDDTAAQASAAGAEVLEIPDRGGKGRALRAGWSQLLLDGAVAAVLMLDGDGQHSADDIPAFLHSWHNRGGDLVVGERNLEGPPMPWARRMTNRCMSWAIRGLSHTACRDTQCGFRLASRRFLSSRVWQATHFELETEMVLHAGTLNRAVANMPIRTIYEGHSSHIRVGPDLGRWLRLLCNERRRGQIFRQVDDLNFAP